MFITENQNVGDSVLFLLSSREALINVIEASGSENTVELASFIHNEASDYEVMHLLLHGSLPTEKYNDVAEMLLFSDLKESMLMNKDFVEEMVGEEIFFNLLHEVDSLYMQYSTAAPVLEFEANQDQELGLAWMLSEVEPRLAMLKKKKAALMTARGRSTQAGFKKGQAAFDTAARQKASAAASKMKGGGGAPSALSRYKGMAGKKIAAAKTAVQGKAAALKSKAYAMSPQAKYDALATKARMGQGAAPAPAPVLRKAAQAQTQATQALGKKVAVGGKTLGSVGGLAAGGAAAAMAIYAGAKIYKRFLSQAARSCKGQKGSAKTLCMNKYKKQAIMKQAAAIQSASSSCAKSKDPAKCKAGVAKKVQSLKAKAASISG